jgi:hypothetical protein
MSELLMKGLASTKRELEAGVADAEAELARTEDYCRKLEELIAVGKATLHAASQVTHPQIARPEFGNAVAAVPDPQLVKDGRK